MGRISPGSATAISATDLDVRNLDKDQDDILIYANTVKDGSGTDLVPLVDTDGHLQVDILTGAGGTQYTEGDTDASITGNALMWEDTGNALVVASAAKPLPVEVTDATIAVTQSGTWDEVGINDSGNSITVDGTVTATIGGVGSFDSFGHLITADINNDIDIQFYRATSDSDLSNIITETEANSGTVSKSNGMATFAATTAASSRAKGVSLQPCVYTAGAEVYMIFTAGFTGTGSGTSYQRIGLYNDYTDGFYIGYEAGTFGVSVLKGGSATQTPKASFSVDTLVGGAGSLFTRAGTPEAINLTKLNVWRIRFGWVGSAPIYFEVLSPDGNWVTFHKILQPNLAAIPSLNTADLYATCDVNSGNSSAALTIITNCWGAGTTQKLRKLSDTLNANTLAEVTRSIITGYSTAGGGAFVNVKVNPSGALTVDATATDLDIRNLTATDVVTANLSATDNAVLDAIEADTTTLAGAVAGTEMQVDVLTMPTVTVTATNLDVQSGGADLATSAQGGAIQTAVELIDDIVYTDDTSTHATGTSKGALIMAAAVPTDTAVNANDIGAVGMTANRELYVSLTTALPAGTNNIGDVDVLSIAAGDNNIGNVDIVTVPAPLSTAGGGTEATALRVTVASDSTGVLSVDDNGGALTVDNGGTFAVQDSQDVMLGTDFSGVLGTGSLVLATQADDLVNTTDTLLTSSFLYGFDGTTWDRLKGDSTDGLLVNLGTNNDVTVTGSVTANAGTNLNTSALLTSTNFADAFGTAGTADSQVMSVQGIASMTPVQVSQATAASLNMTEASASAIKTAVELIDDAIFVDDTATHTPATTKVMGIGMVADDTSTDSVNEGDIGMPRMTLDRKVITTVEPTTSNGLSVFNATSSDGATALTATAQVIKASAGQVYGWYIYNPNTSAQFVQLYNTAAASVTVGTTNPLFMLTIPATSAANVEFTNGIEFTNAGFSIAATSTAGGSGAPSTALDAVIFYK